MNQNNENVERDDDLAYQIRKILSVWKFELMHLDTRKDIVAIKFEGQKVYDGYELYLSGHSWFDENGIWYLDKEWQPSVNYVSLGKETLNIDRLHFLKTLEEAIQYELIQLESVFENFIVVVGLADSDYKRIK